jgi:FMN phosphatase YigB (HAD superfamily)
MKAIIWDLDETIYPTPENFYPRCYEAAVDTALENGYVSDRENAMNKARESYKKYGYSIAAFFLEHNLPKESVEAGFAKRIVNIPAVCPLTLDMIKNFQGMQMVLSHSPKFWVDAFINKLDLDDVIPVTHRMYAETFGHTAKKDSDKPFQAAAAIINLPVSQILVVEDTAENLIHAKNMGMKTALVINGKSIAQPSHVDIMVDRPYQIKF